MNDPSPGAPSPEPGSSPGRRTPVLFLHSLAGNAGHWREQIRHLEPDRLAVAIDLPGHGVSVSPEDDDYSPEAMAAEVSGAIDELALAPVALVGHSYGAAVALALLDARPGDVAGILLVDPASDVRRDPPEELEAFISTLEGDAYRETIEAHYRWALGGARREVSDEVLAGLGATPSAAVIGALRSLRVFDPITPLQDYEGPKRSVIGELGGGPTALHELHPGLRTDRVETAGHWLHMEYPDRFNELLDAFLAEIDRV